MRYESAADVKSRLHGSVVMFEGRPVVVNNVLRKEAVTVQDLITGEEKPVTIKALDLKPVSLGYVLLKDCVVYATRKPVRKWKQGLSADNLTVRDVLYPAKQRINPTSKALAHTIMGIFPSVGEAFQSVRTGKYKVCPFSREWAVASFKDDLCIVYRGEIVGYVGDDFIKLLPERFYLKESLECNLM